MGRQGHVRRRRAGSRGCRRSELLVVLPVPPGLTRRHPHTALRFFGLAPRPGAVDENAWFPVFARLPDLPESREGLDRALRTVVEEAARRGVVGVVDFEFGRGYLDWPRRVQPGLDVLRVRTTTYDDHLDEVVAAGLRTGDALPGGAGPATMGPLKIISDGSLNTRTASCCEPYLDAGSLDAPRGKQNYTLAELTVLLRRARTAVSRLRCTPSATPPSEPPWTRSPRPEPPAAWSTPSSSAGPTWPGWPRSASGPASNPPT